MKFITYMESRIQEVSVVVPEAGKPLTKILLAKFEHGHLKESSSKDLAWNYANAEDGTNDTILSVQGDRKLSYVGRSRRMNGTDGSRYYIGCLHKPTKKMTIHDVELFNLKPTFQDEEKPELVFDDKLTEGQQIDRLNATFGSAKKKRAVNSRLKFNELYGEKYTAAMDTAIEHAVTQPGVEDTTDSPSVSAKRPSSSSNFLPPCHRDAETPTEVYTADQLISPQAMVALKSPAETFVKRTKEQLTEWIGSKEYPSYILEQLKVMPVNELQRWEKAKCLVYLTCMLRLFHLKPADFKKFNCLPTEWPEAVKKELFDQFTMKSVTDKGQRSVRYFPARLKDKLLLYILAMSLILEGAQLDPNILIQDLAVPEKKVAMFYRALGCMVSSQKSSAKKIESGEPTVVLKLPLKLLTDTNPLAKRDSRKRNIRNR